MEEFPSNSQASRDTPKAEEAPRVQSVVTGTVTRRSKPLGRRFLDTFFGDTPKGVAKYILLDVVVPTVKDLIVEMTQEAIERAVHGENAPSRRRPYRSGSVPGYVSYNRVATSSSSPVRREDPRAAPRRVRERHEFDLIEFNTKVDADEVLRTLEDVFEKYSVVSVKDFYSACSITPSFTDERWGWYSLGGARIRPSRGGKYIIDLPPTEALTA